MGKIMLPRITGLLLTCLMLSQSPLLAADATITVTKEQGGREIALKVGNILRIELPGKGGTGYLWLVEGTFAPYLKLMSEATQKVGEPRPGSPVMQVWRLRPRSRGQPRSKWLTTDHGKGLGRPWTIFASNSTLNKISNFIGKPGAGCSRPGRLIKTCVWKTGCGTVCRRVHVGSLRVIV